MTGREKINQISDKKLSIMFAEGFCPKYYGLISEIKCENTIQNKCIKCWENALKNEVEI